MSRLTPYLGIITALAIGILIAVFSGGTTIVHIPEAVVIPDISPLSVMDTVVATSTQTTPDHVPEKNTPPEQTHTSIPIDLTQTTAEPTADLNALLDISASTLRSSLVNIVCYVPFRSGLHSISGSGVIIDSKGIILTNAHIAQYFLLFDRGVSCDIRSGSPATNRYDAALIYISPEWLRLNSNVLTETLPSGTGEYDFAFLAITKSTTSNVLPDTFPYIPLATNPSTAGTPVIIASYGAQFLESNQIASNLSPTIVFGSVKKVFTFGNNTIDVLALGGSAAAQEGSSGGGVADASGNLIGTITTSTVTGSTDTRSLDAITTSYIRAEYASETGEPLEILLSKSSAAAVANFAPKISDLEAIITANLN